MAGRFSTRYMKEIDMITSKPIELGKASDETQEMGHADPDSIFNTRSPPTL